MSFTNDQCMSLKNFWKTLDINKKDLPTPKWHSFVFVSCLCQWATGWKPQSWGSLPNPFPSRINQRKNGRVHRKPLCIEDASTINWQVITKYLTNFQFPELAGHFRGVLLLNYSLWVRVYARAILVTVANSKSYNSRFRQYVPPGSYHVP